jgi:type III restriction enzyme
VDNADVARPVPLRRRPALRDLRLFLPRVCWVQPGQPRRELDYEADVLAHLPWDQVQPDRLVRDWAPGQAAVAGVDAFDIDLSILARAEVVAAPAGRAASASLDRAWLVRAVLDLAPNPGWVWAWVDAVVAQQLQAGVALSALAASQASLAEALRAGLERERDRLAQTVFNDLLAQGRIEFTLRADAADYELPQAAEALLAGTPELMQRSDARPMDKSLLEPCLRTPDTNEFEVAVAGYLDQQAALRWWHRNVARSQYGLQGWRRHRVYPDFVFALTHTDGVQRMVLLETKGLQLAGSIDTDYKRALLHRLTQAFADARLQSAGQMALVADGQVALQCDLVFEQAWQGQLDHRYFAAAGPEPVGH